MSPTRLDEAARDYSRAADAMSSAADTLRGLAVDAVKAGVPKVQVAERAGISRPTLDKWLRVKA